MKKIPASKEKHNQVEEILSREGALAIEEFHRAGQEKLIQEVLETEVDAFLGRKWYEHNEKSKGYRNGYYQRKGLLPGGAVTIRHPRVRNTKEPFVSRILKGLAQYADRVRVMALEMYVRGLSTRDIEKTFIDSNNTPIFSRSVVSKLAERLYVQYQEYSQRDLSTYDIVYLFVDGVYESVRRYTNNQTLLCAWAICSDGAKLLLHLAATDSESKESWELFFADLHVRGLRQPLLVISDGAPGLIAAVEKYFPKAHRQRCIAHKLRNIASKLPRDVQQIILNEVKAVYYAPDTQTAELLAARIIDRYASAYPSAMQCFNDDLESCIAHLKYPSGHRRYIRTTNLLERAFEEQKRRTKVFPQHQHERSALGLVFAVLKRASDSWSRVSMNELEFVQLRNIRSLMCPNEQSAYISYQRAA
jgi:putative transposase